MATVSTTCYDVDYEIISTKNENPVMYSASGLWGKNNVVGRTTTKQGAYKNKLGTYCQGTGDGKCVTTTTVGESLAGLWRLEYAGTNERNITSNFYYDQLNYENAPLQFRKFTTFNLKNDYHLYLVPFIWEYSNNKVFSVNGYETNNCSAFYKLRLCLYACKGTTKIALNTHIGGAINKANLTSTSATVDGYNHVGSDTAYLNLRYCFGDIYFPYSYTNSNEYIVPSASILFDYYDNTATVGTGRLFNNFFSDDISTTGTTLHNGVVINGHPNEKLSTSKSWCCSYMTADELKKFILSIGLPTIFDLEKFNNLDTNVNDGVYCSILDEDGVANIDNPVTGTDVNDTAIFKASDLVKYTDDNIPDVISEDKGGQITGDTTPDNIPNLGSLGVFNRAFAINSNQLSNLVDELWTADDDKYTEIIEGLSMLGANPIESIINLRLYPFDISSKISTGSDTRIKMGRYSLETTGKPITVNSCVSLDLGSITLNAPTSSFMDFEPFSKYKLYIPYCGGVDLPANLVIGHTIQVKMYADLNTGSANAIVSIDNRNFTYLNGTVGIDIPVTASNASEYATSIIHAGANVIKSTSNAVGGVVGNALTGNVAGAITSGISGAVDTAVAGVDFSTKLNDVNIQMQGTASPSNSLYNPQCCYLLREYHAPIIPSNYGHSIGYACRQNGNIATMRGFTVFGDYDISNVALTHEELNELKAILRNGVYC